MNTTLERLTAFLDSKEVHFNTLEEHGVIVAEIATDVAHYRLTLLADDDDHRLLVSLRMPFRTHEARFAEVSELILRLNHELLPGKFDFDHTDGEVRFDISSWFPASGLEDELAERMIRRALGIVDDWLGSFARVLFADSDPREEFVSNRVRIEKRTGASEEPDSGNAPDAPSKD